MNARPLRMSNQIAQNRTGRYESFAMRLHREKTSVYRRGENIHALSDRKPDAPKLEWPFDWTPRTCVMCFDSIPDDSTEILKKSSEFAVCFACYMYLYNNLPCQTKRAENAKKRATPFVEPATAASAKKEELSVSDVKKDADAPPVVKEKTTKRKRVRVKE